MPPINRTSLGLDDVASRKRHANPARMAMQPNELALGRGWARRSKASATLGPPYYAVKINARHPPQLGGIGKGRQIIYSQQIWRPYQTRLRQDRRQTSRCMRLMRSK